MDASLPLHNSNKQLQSCLRSAPHNGLETLPSYFKEHRKLFVKFKKHSKQINYIQAYKHTIEIVISHLATNSFFNADIVEFIALSPPINLFTHCVYILKRPERSNLTYQNSLTLLLYTLQPDKLTDILSSSMNTDVSSKFISTHQLSFIQSLCSLPDLVMNRLSHSLLMVESNKDYTQSPIYPSNFYHLVSHVVFRILSDDSDKTEVFISFIANIFNQISVFGHANIVARNLIAFAESRIANKSKKLDILKNIISVMMPNRLERLLESLFCEYFSKKLSKTSFFSKILLSPDSCPRIKTILIDSFITSKQYPISRINLGHNLIHYLCLECEGLLIEVLGNILDAFSKESYLYSISIEQHQYLCRVIILIIRYYTYKIDPVKANQILLKIESEMMRTEVKDNLMLKFPPNFPQRSLLKQVTSVIHAYLSNSRSEIQLAGKLYSGMLISWINTDPSNKLSFEFPSTDPTFKEFCSLLTSQHEKPPVIEVEKKTMDDEVTDSELASAKILSDMQKMFEGDKPREIILPSSKASETADSDDEIQTIKMPYDQLKTEKKRPLIEILSDSSDTEDLEPYTTNMELPSPSDISVPIQGPFSLRECLEWLNASSENPVERRAKVEATLHKAETLIRSSHDIKIWCLDLAKTLLFFPDQFNTDNFDVLRLNSLIAICVSCPVETAKFLTSEFYKSNNVIMERVDILTCLDRSACELSHISENKVDLSSLKMPLPKRKELKKESKAWEEIITERLKAKTRIISTASQKPKARVVENTFGQVVGYFFYPLLYSYDQQVRCMDLLAGDHWLLTHALKTLGSLIIYAQGTLALRNMVSAILDFVIAIKSVDFPLVKQGICFCILCVLEVSPLFYLLPELSSRLEEIGTYLEGICARDTDEKTRHIASETLTQIKEIFPTV